MIFSSVLFIFCFFPIFLAVYTLGVLPFQRRFPRYAVRAGNVILFLSSLIFYTWGERSLVLVMLTSTAVDYFCGRLISGAAGAGRGDSRGTDERKMGRKGMRRAALGLSITTNLALLGFFKYAGFFTENFTALLSAAGIHDPFLHRSIHVALPLGISFYTFQSMGYTIDVYRRQIIATRNFFDFACFVTMFPQLIAGPIIRYRDIAGQLVCRTINLRGFAEGVKRFVIGLGKKVLVADVLSIPADRIFDLPTGQLTAGLGWLGAVCFTLQLYFDFSGYSDMAIGMGRMLGFRFAENFNYPFIARSVREYWTRWHISLASWFKEYLYYPLGGSRVSVPRVYLNLLTVFFLCGLWHGANWTFILWGLYHGAFILLERGRFGRILDRVWAPAAHLYLLWVNLTSKVLFRSESVSQALEFFKAMLGFARGSGIEQNVWIYLDMETILVLVVAVLGSTPLLRVLALSLRSRAESCRREINAGIEGVFAGLQVAAVLGILLFSVMRIASVTHTPFIYFRF